MSKEMSMGPRARRNWAGLFVGVFLMVFLLVVMTATVVTFMLPEAFASTVRIRVEFGVIKGALNGAVNPEGAAQYDPRQGQSIFALMKSEVILDKVVDILDLNAVWAAKYNAPGKLRSSESRELLKRMLEIRPARNTSIIDVTVYSDDKTEAARIANTFAEVYQTYCRTRREKLLTGSLEQYAKLKDELKSELANKADDAAAADAKITETIARAGELHAAINSGIPSEQVEIVEHAQAAAWPVRPNKPLNIALGIIVGAVAGFVVAGVVVLLGILLRNPQTLKPAQSPPLIG